MIVIFLDIFGVNKEGSPIDSLEEGKFFSNSEIKKNIKKTAIFN